jgi:group II intron reverse transcriptase/maturase
MRPLGIPALEDKIVQGACVILLNAIYEQDFLPFSYGYRPMKDPRVAISELTFQLQYGVYGYLVEADIRGFFDNMDHDWLLRMLSHRINDKAFIHLIRKWLKAGILEEMGEVVHPQTGTPQGGVISPVLANLYLHYALDLWFEKAVKPQIRGEAIICRFADDFVCAFRFKDDAEKFFRILPKRLIKFGLEVSPEKTQILRFSRFHPTMRRRFTFLGFEFYWNNDRKGIPRVQRRTSRKKLQGILRNITEWIRKNRDLPERKFFQVINAKLRGHYNYYGVRGNSNSLWYYYYRVIDICFKWLNRRSQRRSYTWERFKCNLKEYYHIWKPRITEKKHQRHVDYQLCF